MVFFKIFKRHLSIFVGFFKFSFYSNLNLTLYFQLWINRHPYLIDLIHPILIHLTLIILNLLHSSLILNYLIDIIVATILDIEIIIFHPLIYQLKHLFMNHYFNFLNCLINIVIDYKTPLFEYFENFILNLFIPFILNQLSFPLSLECFFIAIILKFRFIHFL